MNVWLRISIGIILLAWVGLRLPSAEIPISDYYRPEMWLRRVVVDRTEFTPDRLERRFRQFLLQGQGAAKLVQLRVFVDREDVLANCQCMTDINYVAWRGQFEEYRNRIAPTAELTIIGHSAVMRIRDLKGRVHIKVLQGNHPLRITADDCVAEAIHVHPDVFRRPQHPRPETEPDLTFYLVAERPLTTSCAETATRGLHRALQVERIAVNVRTDAWFIDGQFPIIYSFQENLNPPSQDAHRRASEIGCWATPGSVRCSGGDQPK